MSSNKRLGKCYSPIFSGSATGAMLARPEKVVRIYPAALHLLRLRQLNVCCGYPGGTRRAAK